MSQCTYCVAGIGQVTVYRLGKYVTIVCPRCQGVGSVCSKCKKPAVFDCCEERERGQARLCVL